MDEYKELLGRYKKGCIFLSNLNPKDSKYQYYLDELLKILNQINNIVIEHPEYVKEV